MDYSTKTRKELIEMCRDKNIKGYSGKKKDEIGKLLSNSVVNKTIITQQADSKSDKLKMIDLFAGTGAFTLAFV